MKRLFPTSLALLLVLASFGHVLAAAFCPRVLGRGCCFAKNASHKHSHSPGHETMAVHVMQMDGMSMDGMNMESMNTGDISTDPATMDHMAMNDMAVDGAASDMGIQISFPALGEGVVENKVDQPVESCAHCVGHSGVANAPVPFV